MIEDLRYILLIILNAPIVIWALHRSYARYKSGASPRKNFLFWIIFWTLVTISLLLAKPIEDYLFQANLTKSPPFGNFDIIEMTGIIWIFYLVYRIYAKFDNLERRVVELNRVISIEIAEKNNSK